MQGKTLLSQVNLLSGQGLYGLNRISLGEPMGIATNYPENAFYTKICDYSIPVLKVSGSCQWIIKKYIVILFPLMLVSIK